MSLLSERDRHQIQQRLSDLASPVRLVFFTQTFGCDSCSDAKRIVQEVASASDKVSVEEFNLVLDKEQAAAYGVDRAPAIAIVGAADYGVRFYGAPAGFEFSALLDAIEVVGRAEPGLSEASLAKVNAVDAPTHVQVFSTPTCPHCPKAVALAVRMAVANPHIRASAYSVVEYPDLARQYAVTGVPKTVVNDTVQILGALPEAQFIEQALEKPAAA